MIADTAYWAVSTITVATSTLMGFVIVAAIFYLEKTGTFYRSLDWMKDYGDMLKTRKQLIEWDTWLFLLIFLPYVGLGAFILYSGVDILLSVDSTDQLPQHLVGDIESLCMWFATFLMLSGGNVVFMIYMGLLKSTTHSEKFLALGETLRHVTELGDRVRVFIVGYLADKSKELGRKLTEEEIQEVVDALKDPGSDVSKRLMTFIRTDTQKLALLLEIAGFDNSDFELGLDDKGTGK